MTQVKNKKVGFIGLGSMGKPMATNILKAKIPLTVYDIREEPLAEMEKLGAKVASSIKEVGKESDTVVVMVLNYPQIKEVVLPPEGVLGGMRSGSTLIVTSTISPLEIMEVEKVAQECGVAVLDSPVSGGRRGAEEGSLAIMVGGSGKALRENKAVLGAMGKNIYHVGKVGQGQAEKMINQMLFCANIVSLAEAMVMAKKLGLNLPAMVDIQSKSSGDSFVLRNYAPRMIAGDFEAKAAINVLIKDTRLIMDTGLKLDVLLPISSLSYQLYRMADSRGLGRQDVSAIMKVFEELTGVKVSHDNKKAKQSAK